MANANLVILVGVVVSEPVIKDGTWRGVIETRQGEFSQKNFVCSNRLDVMEKVQKGTHLSIEGTLRTINHITEVLMRSVEVYQNIDMGQRSSLGNS